MTYVWYYKDTEDIIKNKERGILMSFLELAKERYSVRKFSDKKVEDDKLELILEAGRVAPTAKNYQPQRILVLRSEENIEKLKKLTPCTYGATTALMVCGDTTTAWVNEQDGRNSAIVDASIVATHMMMEAQELGVGSLWAGMFHHKEAMEMFDLPEGVDPFCILMLGYPTEECKPAGLHFKKLDKEKTVFYDKF